MKLVYLEWQDAHALGEGWTDDREIKEMWKSNDMIIKQCGFVIKEDSKSLLLAGQYVIAGKFVEKGYGNVVKIPKGWIKKRIDLTTYI